VDTRFPAATAGVAASLIRVPPIADLVSVLKGLSIVCWAIPSGPLLLVRPYPYIGERYMGNKYHVLHRHCPGCPGCPGAMIWS
jgi:hypothetical protein